MNIQAANDLASADSDLLSVLGQVEPFLDPQRVEDLRAIQRAWLEFRDYWAKFRSEWHKGGTIRPTLYASSARAETLEWIAKLRKYLEWLKLGY